MSDLLAHTLPPRKKKHILAFFVAMCGLALLGAVIFVDLVYQSKPLAAPLMVSIEPGLGAQEVAGELKKQEAIRYAPVFSAWVFITGIYDDLQSGDYQFTDHVSVASVAQALSGGHISENVTQVRILEGWNLSDIRDYLDRTLNLYTIADFAPLVENYPTPSLATRSARFLATRPPKKQSLEGFFFPDTYQVYNDSNPQALIDKALLNLEKKITPAMEQRAEDQGMTIYELLTRASLLEKEVQTAEDKSVVAGIIANRLSIGMALELDSTVNYVTGKSTARVTNFDLQIDSPYNTYKYPGLPPGPICNPGLESIQAVLNPTESDYLYFLTDPEGKAYFSQTLEEHVQKKQQFY